MKEKTEKQKAFLDALGGNEAKGNIRKAMDIAGYSRGVKQGNVVGPLKEEIIEIARNELAANSLNAVYSLSSLLNDPSDLNAKTTLATVREILDRSGLVKEENLNVKSDQGGVVLLPPKDRSSASHSDLKDRSSDE